MIDFQNTLKHADEWLAQSSNTIDFLRIVLVRARPGMSDFLIKASIPSDKVTLITVRANKAKCNTEGYSEIAKSLVEAFQRQDNLIDWKTVNIDHLGEMVSSELKFFSQNPSTELMRFVTEALEYTPELPKEEKIEQN